MHIIASAEEDLHLVCLFVRQRGEDFPDFHETWWEVCSVGPEEPVKFDADANYWTDDKLLLLTL